MPSPDQPRFLPIAQPVAQPVGPEGLQPIMPLYGLTILAVEDSRYACEALRLIAQRAGARLRRAETLDAARAHLRTYRPDVALVDLGLPDGRGETLIRELVLARPRAGAIIGMSGLPEGRASALAAGADGYLDKPLEGFSAFCALLARFLPERVDLSEIAAISPLPAPDPLALQDDFIRATAALRRAPDRASQRYLAGFLAGIARVTQDDSLASASERAERDPSAIAPLRTLIEQRLAAQGPQIAPNQLAD
jgi:CheY-like chemotaxis protein